MTFLLYIFCRDLPLAYKIIAPLEALATLVIICQRLYYDTTLARKWLHSLYLINALLFLAFIPWAIHAPLICGNFFGWLTLVISAVNQLPQVVKIFHDKSVRGFSFMFVILGGIAAIVEFVASVALSLPIQTIINAFRGIVMFFVFCFQFAVYRK